jgi:Na+-translocating ferredoxin:NAD+ oxidoreductase RnfC subunit
LHTHIGQPAKATVREGDMVHRGDVIATVDENQLGCPAHASLAGRVTSVTAEYVEIASE